MDPAQVPIRASTQEHLEIEDIKDNLLILKNGSCSLVLKTTAVNFGLLSESEQDATIYAYAGLLNSLNFPIQIFIHSQKKDISAYLALLKEQEEKQPSAKLKEQIRRYQQFVEKIVRENKVLDKSFYVIVPFSSFELGVPQAIKGGVLKKSSQLPFPKEYIIEKAKTALYPKRDHLIRQFNRLGLKTVQLNTKQLIELFYNIYNPESEGQKLSEGKEYSTPLVEPLTEQSLTPTPSQESELETKPIPNQPRAIFSSSEPQTELAEGSKLQQKINDMVQKTTKKI